MPLRLGLTDGVQTAINRIFRVDITALSPY
jgi:hypothetical protein